MWRILFGYPHFYKEIVSMPGNPYGQISDHCPRDYLEWQAIKIYAKSFLENPIGSFNVRYVLRWESEVYLHVPFFYQVCHHCSEFIICVNLQDKNICLVVVLQNIIDRLEK